MSESKTTPGPWNVGEYDDMLGYDGMTGGVRVGPVVLDGCDYGQRRGEPLSADGLSRMMADARLIAAAPIMYDYIKTKADAGDWEAIKIVGGINRD